MQGALLGCSEGQQVCEHCVHQIEAEAVCLQCHMLAAATQRTRNALCQKFVLSQAPTDCLLSLQDEEASRTITCILSPSMHEALAPLSALEAEQSEKKHGW